MTDDKPPSLRNFDYFSEEHQPAPEAVEDLPPGLEEQLAAYRQLRKRQTRVLLLAGLALAAAVWFLWGFRDEMTYAFATADEPLELGDVTRITPRDLHHNTYVSLQGITEHRGLTLKLVRGLSVSREELWYFRLLGSRGVFIEVEPDEERWGFTTAVNVSGRVIDPERVLAYQTLVSSYTQLYHPQERPEYRVVQVGVMPGEGRLPYVLAILVLLVLFSFNVWAVSAIWRARRDAARRGIIQA